MKTFQSNSLKNIMKQKKNEISFTSNRCVYLSNNCNIRSRIYSHSYILLTQLLYECDFLRSHRCLGFSNKFFSGNSALNNAGDKLLYAKDFSSKRREVCSLLQAAETQESRPFSLLSYPRPTLNCMSADYYPVKITQ